MSTGQQKPTQQHTHSIRRRTVTAAALAAFTLSALAACGSSDEPATTTPSSGGGGTGPKLTIGVPFDEPGLGLKSGDSYSGFDIDTAKYVAKALGTSEGDITWVEANPEDRETLLTSGKADMVVATYSITDQRKQQVDFAGPYFVAHQDLLVRRNDEDLTGPDTLSGRKLCSVTGTTSAALVKTLYKGNIQLQEYPKYSECVAALAKGDIDAVTTDDVILAGYSAQKPYRGQLRLVGKGFSDERYGVGLKKGDTEMVTKVNAALKSYIDDGSWKKSLDSTVGPSGYTIPDPPTPGSS
jgi:glutamate transport system substrate-binding protein